VRRFQYKRVVDVDGALAAAGSGTAYLGGGTTIVDLMKLSVESREVLVDVSRLAGAPSVSEAARDTADGVWLPAAARNSDVAAHPLVRRRYPALSEALLSGASPQIRNMATVGGNLLQRTRCAYFRDAAVPACNKRVLGSGCAAQAKGSWSRMHAVLGGSAHCIAVHPSDMCVALVALDAVVHTRRRAGTRAIPIAELHTEPDAHPEIETVLEPDELVTHVVLPPSAFAARSCYVKVRDRSAFAFALASTAVALDLVEPSAKDAGRIRAARVVLGGVATKPWRSREVEEALVGHVPSLELFERAAARAVMGARATSQNAFKVVLIQRTIVRALGRASGVAT
jgi:xanthine dehydrogenase YagS FAD-binding subunit